MYKARSRTFSLSSHAYGTNAAYLVGLLCICVAAQMLGTPITLGLLLTSDMSAESVSEDFSILPLTPELERMNRLYFLEEVTPLLYHSIFSTSVFHPPQV